MRNLSMLKREFLAIAAAAGLTGLPWVVGQRHGWFRSEQRRYRDAVWTTSRTIKPDAAVGVPPSRLHTVRLFSDLSARIPWPWLATAQEQRGRRACVAIKIPSGRGHSAGHITLRPLFGPVRNLREQYFGRNEYGPSVRAYYGSVSAFLAPYATPLLLWRAIFHARPADVRWTWGRARWRLDTLLMLKPGFLGGWETDLLQARHVTAFIKGVGQSGGNRAASGDATPTRNNWRGVVALFDDRGNLRYAVVKIRITGLRKPVALRALVTIFSDSSFLPAPGIQGEGNGR